MQDSEFAVSHYTVSSGVRLLTMRSTLAALSTDADVTVRAMVCVPSLFRLRVFHFVCVFCCSRVCDALHRPVGCCSCTTCGSITCDKHSPNNTSRHERLLSLFFRCLSKWLCLLSFYLLRGCCVRAAKKGPFSSPDPMPQSLWRAEATTRPRDGCSMIVRVPLYTAWRTNTLKYALPPSVRVASCFCMFIVCVAS